jgi:TRIAD3 protein (E3 ubiquitin-protein ligase RNF216)
LLDLNFDFLEDLPPLDIRDKIRQGQLKDFVPPARLTVLGVPVTLPRVPDATNLQRCIQEATRLSLKFDLAKASLFLRILVTQGTVPGDVLDRIILAGADDRTLEASLVLKEQAVAFLTAAFPSASHAAVSRSLRANRFLIPEAAESLRKANRPVTNGCPVHVTDAAVAVALWAISEGEEARGREEKQRRLAEEARRAEELRYLAAKASHELIECQCCFDSFLFDDLVQCPEAHLFCRKCLRRHIETAIAEGRVDVPCLAMGDCSEHISVAELERTMPEAVLRRLFKTETMNAVVNSDLQHLVKCHKCGFIAVFEGRGAMRCPECKAQTCSGCGAAYPHDGKTCEQMKAIDKNRLVEEKMSEAVVRICPRCDAQFMKEDGCNKMECPRCHTWICYFCRKIIPKGVGYEHFWRHHGPCPPGRCPLWIPNETLHDIEAQKAKRHAKEDLNPTPP